MTNPITLQELYNKVSTNRTKTTRRSITRDALFEKLEDRTCFGGDLYSNYAEFRQAVIEVAMNHPYLPSKYQVAALNFNNLRNDINDYVSAYGSLDINGKVYPFDKIYMHRDPATKPTNKPRIPKGKWFIVNKKTGSVSEGLNNRKNADKICDKSTQSVMSRKKYITEIL